MVFPNLRITNGESWPVWVRGEDGGGGEGGDGAEGGRDEGSIDIEGNTAAAKTWSQINLIVQDITEQECQS